MGLILSICCHPTPRLDGTDDGLATFMDMDVLDANPLLAFAAMLIEGQHQIGIDDGIVWQPA